ncbi:MAG: alanine racemase [Clostridiales bacterium]|nr:alanine racemase [Clostridiales bacterium]
MLDENTQAAQVLASRPSFAEVDLGAIGRNIRMFKDRIMAQQARARQIPAQEASHGAADRPLLMAVVKANAYGHGAIAVANTALAQGADWLGVALPQEAMELAQAGIHAPILVLGYTEPEAYKPLIRMGARITIYTLDQGIALAAAAASVFGAEAGDAAEAGGGAENGVGAGVEDGAGDGAEAGDAVVGRKVKVHIKIDTGMGRIGFRPGEEAVKEIKALSALDTLELEGCFTHFACADEEEDACWLGQLESLHGFIKRLGEAGLAFPIIHCANTAAFIRSEAAWMDMVRIGIGVYGLYPSAAAKAWGLVTLAPALRWRSMLSHVKVILEGEGVGYGHDWAAPKDTLIGTVPLGYADGYPKALDNKGVVLVNGRRAPVVGRVCMDQFMVDLSMAPDARPGDEVVLIGTQGDEEISADEMACLIGTTCYEVVNIISSRIPRRYQR